MVSGFLPSVAELPPAERLRRGNCLAASFLQEKFPGVDSADFFLQFGPGFDTVALFDSEPLCLPMDQLPGMPLQPTPDQVQPCLQFGCSRGVPVLVSQGHRHLSEGLGLYPCILPLATAWHLGIRKHLFIDNGISLIPEIKTGNWTLLTDFLNGYAFSPLDGLHELLENFFPNLNHALSQEFNSEVVNALDQVGINFKLCTYQALPGFHFCTGAEAALARKNGADVLGHDLVMEIILSHALGCRVSAAVLACGQNLNAGHTSLKRHDVLATCQFCGTEFLRGLGIALQEISRAEKKIPQIRLPDAEAGEILQQSITIKTGKKHPFKLLRKEES